MTRTFYLVIPPFKVRVESDCPLFIENLLRLYSHSLGESSEPVDFHLAIMRSSGLRRWVKPQVNFFFDEQMPFKPLPVHHGFAMFEWGLNWVIAGNHLTQVIIHSAVLAKDDKAVLFPAHPGSGKSTLSSYFAAHGWRLLSDEMTFIVPNSLKVVPFVRPICLKNQSIELAKQWYPAQSFSSLARNTHKGDVAHLVSPKSSWSTAREQASIKAIVFPTYKADTPTTICQLNEAQAFMTLAEHAFNFDVVGHVGFSSLTQIVEAVPAMEIEYSDLSDLAMFIDQELL